MMDFVDLNECHMTYSVLSCNKSVVLGSIVSMQVSLSQQNSIGPGDEWHDCICDENPTSESLLAISIS